MKHDFPELPVEKLRAAIPAGDDAHAQIDALRRELVSQQPRAAAIKEHVESLREHASLRTLITSWFDDPRTQLFINDLILEGF